MSDCSAFHLAICDAEHLIILSVKMLHAHMECRGCMSDKSTGGALSCKINSQRATAKQSHLECHMA